MLSQLFHDLLQHLGARPDMRLSQIAREITGAAWSGPRFFGLKSSKTNGPQS